MATQTKEELTGSDADYGYRFGCDGVVSFKKAAADLGVHHNTISNMCDDGRLRPGTRLGKNGEKSQKGNRVVCVRSLNNYIDKIKD